MKKSLYEKLRDFYHSTNFGDYENKMMKKKQVKTKKAKNDKIK